MSNRTSQMPAAAALAGTELVPLSQLSATVTITATTLSAQASDNSFNDSGNGFVAAGFTVGKAVKISGFTGNAANNILSAVVTAVTAGKLTIGGTDGDVIVDDAAGESVTITQWDTVRTTAQDVADLGGGGGVTAGTPASLSGTSVTVTGIPAAKIIHVPFVGMSTNGSSHCLLQLGTSGGVVTSGYASAAGYFNTSSQQTTNSAAGILLFNGAASNVLSGEVVLTNVSGNTWAATYMATDGAAAVIVGTGSVTLSGTLDRIKFTTVNGTDAYDGGTANVLSMA